MQVAETFAFEAPAAGEPVEAAEQPSTETPRSPRDATKNITRGVTTKDDSKRDVTELFKEAGSADIRSAEIDKQAVAGGAANVPSVVSSGRSLMDIARLDTCVTVVDAANFYSNLQSIEEVKDR